MSDTFHTDMLNVSKGVLCVDQCKISSTRVHCIAIWKSSIGPQSWVVPASRALSLESQKTIPWEEKCSEWWQLKGNKPIIKTSKVAMGESSIPASFKTTEQTSVTHKPTTRCTKSKWCHVLINKTVLYFSNMRFFKKSTYSMQGFLLQVVCKLF